MTAEQKKLILSWFDHIEQLARDRKTRTGVTMTMSDTLDEIRCLAKGSKDYVEKYIEDTNQIRITTDTNTEL